MTVDFSDVDVCGTFIGEHRDGRTQWAVVFTSSDAVVMVNTTVEEFARYIMRTIVIDVVNQVLGPTRVVHDSGRSRVPVTWFDGNIVEDHCYGLVRRVPNLVSMAAAVGVEEF